MLYSAILAQAAIAGLVAAIPLPQFYDIEDNQSKVQVTEVRWPKLVRYAKFSAASTNSVCPSPPYGSTVQQYINVRSTDTQATLFRDDEAKEFILAFPGTASKRDWQTDSDETLMAYTNQAACTGCYIHQGFYEAWLSSISTTTNALDSALGQYKDYNVTVAGHSLGAALASLAYTTLMEYKYPVSGAYTYGQPRVGNQQYANHVDKLSGASEEKIGIYHRATHSYDGVPQVPSESEGYRHSRTEYFEQDPSGESSTYRCFGQESNDCNKKYSRGFLNDAHNTYSGIHMGGTAQCST